MVEKLRAGESDSREQPRHSSINASARFFNARSSADTFKETRAVQRVMLL
jgi:hypothetical protein